MSVGWVDAKLAVCCAAPCPIQRLMQISGGGRMKTHLQGLGHFKSRAGRDANPLGAAASVLPTGCGGKGGGSRFGDGARWSEGGGEPAAPALESTLAPTRARGGGCRVSACSQSRFAASVIIQVRTTQTEG